MNKFTVAGLPLPITSVILGYNLVGISPVAAQEDSLFDLSLVDIPAKTYVATYGTAFSTIQDQEANLQLDLDLSFESPFARAIFSSLAKNSTQIQQTSDFYLFHPNNLLNLQSELLLNTDNLDNLNLGSAGEGQLSPASDYLKHLAYLDYLDSLHNLNNLNLYNF